MNKRYKEQIEEFIYKGEKIPFSLGTIVLCFFSLLLMVLATFTQVELVHLWPVYDNIYQSFAFSNIKHYYIAQIPIVLFISAILGPRFSLFVMILYLLLGFFVWPIFALGGGLEYVKSGLFGYILGYIFACYPVGRILEKKHDLKSSLIATIVGVSVIHLCGFFYCLILAIFREVDFSYVSMAFDSLGGIKTVYDLIISFLMLLFAIPSKMVFWILVRSFMGKIKPKKAKKS